eukprot:scaffold152505_cov33-Tisochrysis_lutea.AAC.1
MGRARTVGPHRAVVPQPRPYRSPWKARCHDHPADPARREQGGQLLGALELLEGNAWQLGRRDTALCQQLFQLGVLPLFAREVDGLLTDNPPTSRACARRAAASGKKRSAQREREREQHRRAPHGAEREREGGREEGEAGESDTFREERERERASEGWRLAARPSLVMME